MNLQVKNLQVKIDRQDAPILDIPYLELASGKTLIISGASGSGKTTLIHHLCGLSRTAAAEIIWHDVNISQLTPAACDLWRGKNVGLIMQNFHLIEGLSALDNVLLPSAIRRFPRKNPYYNHALNLLDRLGITHPRQRVETHSRGEMQRIAIARALLLRPAILIADEPTASLDAKNSADIIALLQEISREHGITLICVSHDEALIAKEGEKLVLAHGKIAQTTLNTTLKTAKYS